MGMNVVNHQEDSVTGKLVRQKSINGAASVTQYSLPADFRAMVTPTISGVPTAEKYLNDNTSAFTYFLRATAMASADDVTAANRLMDKQPDVHLVYPSSVKEISSETAITAVYVVGVGSATYTTGNVISTSESTLANVQTAQIKFLFEASDNVRKVVLTAGETYTSGQYLPFQILGYSYA